MFGKKKQAEAVDATKPVMLVVGNGGSIELWPHKIVIRRKGIGSTIAHGKKGEKEIYLHAISSIQLKKPGKMTAGYFQIALAGGNESKGGLFAATEDENTLMFNKNYDNFVALKNEIENRIVADRHPQAVSESAPVSVADELAKMANLRDSGVLSDKEFDAQKKRLLGQ